MKTWVKSVLIVGVILAAIIITAAVLINAKLSKIRTYEPAATVAPQDETF